MINFFGKDSAYFKITSPEGSIDVAEKDVISFNVNEEVYKLTTGSITLLDNDLKYTSNLKRGQFIEIEWGYLNPPNILTGRVNGSPFRKGVKAMLMSPSMSIGDISTTTWNFRSGFSLITNRYNKNHMQATKKDVIESVILSSGIQIYTINFRDAKEKPERGLRQNNETDFEFLTRKAKEWKCFFRVGQNLKGQDVAVFCDYDSKLQNNFANTISGASPGVHLFEHGRGLTNVIDASIEMNVTESGGGEIIKFVLIDGQPVKQSYEGKIQTVKTYRLDMEKVNREVRRIRNTQGVEAATKFTADILNATSFEDQRIKRFWTPIDYITAPNRTGWQANINTFGNTLYTAGQVAELGLGFPEDAVRDAGLNKTRQYTMKTVNHSITSEGYRCALELTNNIQLLG